MLRREDDLLLAQREADFQERVIAGTIAHDHELTLAKAMFPDKVQEAEKVEETSDGGAIFYPATDEDFAEMLRQFEAQ